MTTCTSIRALSAICCIGVIAVLLFDGRLAHAQILIDPGVIYSVGGKSDHSINESVARGISHFKTLGQFASHEFEPADENLFEQGQRKFARARYHPIIVVGSLQIAALSKIAREFPKAEFILIDGQLGLPNVRSVTFKEHEGSFLVGIAAAMVSKSGKVGFVGGLDTLLTRWFQCGYEQGVKCANPKVTVISAMVGTTPAAWNDPQKGAELAKSQFDRGVDVVFAAAGGTGIGVLQAAKDRGKLAIGGTNQNRLFPGTMLTSMTKRFDSAVFETLAIASKGRWKSGHTSLGLREDSVGWTVDEYNQDLVTPAMQDKVDEAKDKIVEGKLAVHCG